MPLPHKRVAGLGVPQARSNGTAAWGCRAQPGPVTELVAFLDVVSIASYTVLAWDVRCKNRCCFFSRSPCFMSADKAWLASVIPRLSQFLRERLHLELHPDKLTIRTLSS
ncbi:MAG: hypothetical protein QGF90_05775, partial [Gammaproteobacteria bacterium]|nr:hypothetical protein [Gammaproteobacteria bacterium]